MLDARCIANQLRALRDRYSPAITADVAKLEGELASIQARLKTSDPQTVKLQMRDTRRFVESRLEDLSALWNGEPRLGREGIAKHLQKIYLKPMHRTYVASGNWDWLGNLANCGQMINRNRCKGLNQSALGMHDWKACPACEGTGSTGQRCVPCDGAGWVFVRGKSWNAD
jgi:hypothetical protein